MLDNSIPTQPATYTHIVKAVVLNRILLALSFVGLFVAGMLSMEKYLHVILPCGEAHGCETVAMHPSSELFGVLPVAYIGLGGYILFAALAVRRMLTSPNDALLTKIGLWAAILGTVYSLYLQFISFTVIHAMCPYCLTSAVTMVLTTIVYWMLQGTVGKEVIESYEITRFDTWMVGVLPVLLVVGLVSATGLDRRTVISGSKSATLAELVPADPKSLGPSDAPLTVVEFADLCCHSCQTTAPKVKDFMQEHLGKIRLVFRHYPLPMHPLGETAAAMAEYAFEKGRFWDFAVSVMGLNRQPESVDELLGIAKSIGLDTNDLKKHLKDAKDPVYAQVTADMNTGHAVGVSSTPTFFLLAKGLQTDVAGPNDIIQKLGSDRYKSLLAANGT